jgi:cytochrome P450
MSSPLPSFDVDPFCDELLADPHGYYRELRDAGPVVYLTRYDVLGLTRYEHVRGALRDWKSFTSTRGVAFNDAANEDVKEVVLCMDPPEHTEGRAVLTNRFGLSETRKLIPLAERKADELVAALVEKGSFDGVKDLAEPYVSSFVCEVVGVPDSAAEVLVAGSTAGFASVGPMNQRAIDSFPLFQESFEVTRNLTKKDMRPGSIGWDILDAEERGELPEAMRMQLLLNFMGASFDTTINAMASTVWLLATNAAEWDLLRSDPSLIPAAINEGIRVESPIQIWSRFCTRTVDIGGITVPADKRVAVFIGSANRDERHYPEPDAFDIRRNPADHLGFGHGIHLCIGAPLARLELSSVLASLIDKVTTIELTGDPTRRLTNTTRGFETLPVRVT